jgi:hypothetical protein
LWVSARGIHPARRQQRDTTISIFSECANENIVSGRIKSSERESSSIISRSNFNQCTCDESDAIRDLNQISIARAPIENVNFKLNLHCTQTRIDERAFCNLISTVNHQSIVVFNYKSPHLDLWPISYG